MTTTTANTSTLSFHPQGEFAILCEANAEGALDLALQQRIWALAERLEQRQEVLESVPGMNNLLLIFHAPVTDFGAWVRTISVLWESLSSAQIQHRQVIVPVIYGGQAGYDLQYVAESVGLTPIEYAKHHANGVYQVYALGSQPGFAYLGGMDPRLAVKRREVPRPRVEEGAIIIGGPQTGILSRTTPSGWHVIGHTSLRCFDPAQSPPALLQPGDTVKFEFREFLS